MADLFNVHPEVLRRFRAFERAIRQAGYSITITSGFRSIEQQRKLFAARAAGKHPFPVAPPGCSEHNHGVAIDAVTSLPEQWLAAGARHFGLVWAGPSDKVHFGVFTGSQWRSLVKSAPGC